MGKVQENTNEALNSKAQIHLRLRSNHRTREHLPHPNARMRTPTYLHQRKLIFHNCFNQRITPTFQQKVTKHTKQEEPRFEQ